MCTKIHNLNSTLLIVKTGILKRSILGPIFISIYLNDLVVGLNPIELNLYADDTINYTLVLSLKVAVDSLRIAINSLHVSF